MAASVGTPLTLALVCLMAAAAAAAPSRLDADCIDPSILSFPNVNLYPPGKQIVPSSGKLQSFLGVTTVSVATQFQVKYYPTFNVLTNLLANETYVLHQCGVPSPNLDAYNLQGAKVFQVPLRAISVKDTTVIGFLKLLGVQNRVGYVTEYAVDACMQALGAGECGRLDVNATSNDIDAVFDYGVRSSNPQAITFTATSDPGPLNRAEHIKYLAAFFNKEAVANKQFDAIVSSYTAVKQAVQAALAASSATKPLVAWAYYRAGSTWGVEKILFYSNAYRTQYVEDAGGRMLDFAALAAMYKSYADGKSVVMESDGLAFYNLSTTMPAWQAILKEADIVVDETYYGFGVSPMQVNADLFRARFNLTSVTALSTYKFLAGQKLYRLDGTSNPAGLTSWFEEAVARPDKVLADLAAAITPTALPGNYNPTLVRSVFATPRSLLAQASQCPLAGCQFEATAICPNVYKDCQGNIVEATEAQPCAPAKCNSVPILSLGGGSRRAGMPGWAALLLALATLLAVIF